MSKDDQTIKWKYEPKQDPSVIPVMCCDTVNGDPKVGATNTNAPFIMKDKLMTDTASG